MYKEIFLNKSKQKAPSKLFLFKVVLPFQEIPSGTDAYKLFIDYNCHDNNYTICKRYFRGCCFGIRSQ